MTKCLNINAYGCSFSQGLKNIDNGKSWPNYLLELIPDNCCINNYALAGSSLEYSVYNLQKQKNYADINIFQNDKIFKIDKYAVDAGDHFSKEGNMLIAENVYNKIKEKLI
jgi:hypothetical protein